MSFPRVRQNGGRIFDSRTVARNQFGPPGLKGNGTENVEQGTPNSE